MACSICWDGRPQNRWMSCRACSLARDGLPKGLQGLQHGKCWAAHLTGQISAQACVHAAVNTVALGVQACRVTVAEKIRRCPPQCKGQVQHGVLQACQAHCCKAVGAGTQGQPCT